MGDTPLPKSARPGARSSAAAILHNGGLRKATLPDGTRLDRVIDARGRRVGKKRNGTPGEGLAHDGQLRIIAELDGAGTVISRVVYGTMSYIAEYVVRGGIAYRFNHDDLGSVRLGVNTATGTVAQRINYDE